MLQKAASRLAATGRHGLLAVGAVLLALLVIAATVAPEEDPVTTTSFGVIGDGSTNDAAAFRSFWEYLRGEWYNHGRSHTARIVGNILLASPVEDCAGQAIYVCDFPVTLEGDYGSQITVTGSTAASIFQIGTYASPYYRSLTNVRINGNGTAGGFALADTAQGRLRGSNLVASNCTTAFRAVNLQDAFLKGLVAVSPQIGFDLTQGNVPRVYGSNGSYWVLSQPSHCNNNSFEVVVQAPVTTGILCSGGINNTFTGLVQGGTPAGWFLDAVDGSGLSIRDFWLETSSTPHRELRFRDSFSGTATLLNVTGATTGANATILGGKITWFDAASWIGRIDAVAPATVICDHSGGAARTGPILCLDRFQPVAVCTDTVADQAPMNRALFSKGEVAAGSAFVFAKWGQDASGNECKGIRAYVHLWETGTSNQCTIEMFADGRATYPAARSSVEEKLGTLAEVHCAVQAYKVGASPYHQMRTSIQNNSSHPVRYEIWYHVFAF